MTVYPSDNQRVRLAVAATPLSDRMGMTGWASFDGQVLRTAGHSFGLLVAGQCRTSRS